MSGKGLKIATQSHQLPGILHVHKAHNEALQLLRELDFHEGGIVHAFNDSLNEAQHYQQLGFKFGFYGMPHFRPLD